MNWKRVQGNFEYMRLKGGTEESHEERRDSRCPDLDSIPSPPKYNPEVLTLALLHPFSLFRDVASLPWQSIMK
jgi:hypothetical protein